MCFVEMAAIVQKQISSIILRNVR